MFLNSLMRHFNVVKVGPNEIDVKIAELQRCKLQIGERHAAEFTSNGFFFGAVWCCHWPIPQDIPRCWGSEVECREPQEDLPNYDSWTHQAFGFGGWVCIIGSTIQLHKDVLYKVHQCTYVYIYMYVCIYIYMYVYICMYIYIYMTTYICICINVYIYILCLNKHIYIYNYTHMFLCVYIYICAVIYLHMQRYIYIYIYMHIYIYIHVYVHIYMYIYISICVCVCPFGNLT